MTNTGTWLVYMMQFATQLVVSNFGEISVTCSVWLFGTRAFATKNELGCL